MKRLIIFAALLFAAVPLAAYRAFSDRLLDLAPDGGIYSVFSGGKHIVFEKPPDFAPAFCDSERWDFVGDVFVEIAKLDGSIVKVEEIGGTLIIYAYSPLLPKSKTLSCGRVNLMAATGNGNCLGYPILGGSY